MPEINPYESPRETGPPESSFDDEQGETPDGVWRDGPYLVMQKRARLLNRCVKSNRPATRRLRRVLVWHHPAIYATIPIGPFVCYFVLYLLFRQTATIQIGLCDECFGRRRRRALIAFGTCLAAFLILAMSTEETPFGSARLAVLGGICLVLLATGICGYTWLRLVSPARITKEYVWLKGVHPDFLASLPRWPGKT